MAQNVVLWNRQWFRIMLGVSLILVGLYVTTPYLLNFRSNKGVVNSGTVVISSPIEGFVRTDGFAVGDWVKRGDLVLRVDNALQNRSFINELQTEQSTLKARVIALGVQAGKLKAIKDRLFADNGRYRDHTLVHLANQIAQGEADEKALVVLLAAAEDRLSRSVSLHKDGILAEISLIEARSRRDELNARIEAVLQQVAALRGNLAAVEQGVYVGNGRNDVPYSLQRLDEVEIALADIRARRTEYVARIGQIDNQIRVEQQRLAMTSQYEGRAPMSGVLWRSYAHDGAPTAPNNELVVIADCSNLFVDSVVSNSHVDAIRIGDAVSIRLLGEFAEIDGVVTGIYGASMKTVDRVQPAVLPQVKGDEVVVRARISVLELPDWKRNYCFIGRQVAVKFSRPYLMSASKFWEMLASVY